MLKVVRNLISWRQFPFELHVVSLAAAAAMLHSRTCSLIFLCPRKISPYRARKGEKPPRMTPLTFLLNVIEPQRPTRMSEKPEVVEQRFNRSPNPTVNKLPDASSLVMSHDQNGRSKWSREQVKNSNAIDLFFSGCIRFSDFGSMALQIPIIIIVMLPKMERSCFARFNLRTSTST